MRALLVILLAFCAACDSSDIQQTNAVLSDLIESASSPAKPVIQACEQSNSSFESGSNYNLNGPSMYHGRISGCVDGVEISLAIWTAEDILFGFASKDCPDKRRDSLDARNELPSISVSSERQQRDIREARIFLQNELREFRERCGLPPLSETDRLKPLFDLLQEELRRSWIMNRFSELLPSDRQPGPPEESELAKAREQAIEEYAQTH